MPLARSLFPSLALSVSLALAAAACGDSGPGVAAPASHTSTTSSTSSTGTTASTGHGGAGGSTSTGQGGGAGGADACVARAASLQKLLDDTLPQTKAPGAVLSVSTPDCGLWSGATGTSTPKEPMKPGDLVRIGSVTKTFVASVVLELVGEGKLALDDRLEQHHPGFPGGAGITIRQLMNHTSGIFNYSDDKTWEAAVAQDPKRKWQPQELVDVAAGNPPYAAPGKLFHYSNTNYILLGMIVETLTQSTIAAEIRERLLDPQKLAHTTFDGAEPLAGTLAHGYGPSPAKGDMTTVFDPSWAWSAGAMVSTSADLVAWAKALYGGGVLSQALFGDMIADPVPTQQAGVSYGLGVFELDASVALDTAYGHGGDIPGYHTPMWYLPKEQLALAATVNSDDGSPNPITAAVRIALVPH
jgi:D-alanyl-D-alanine carboxypeptidase